jgi:hypothetical protein
MAIEFDIQVRNGKVKITVGGGPASAGDRGGASPGAASGQTGGASPGADSGQTGGAEPGSGCCCAPVIVGPIVVDGSSLQGRSAQGGASPGADSGQTGGASPGADSGQTGGGGPGSGCCCAPLVIGPIVITSCRSGHSGSSSGDPGTTTSQAVTVNPPTQVQSRIMSRAVMGPMTDFTMQTQQQSNWCWAAVAVSINDFLDPQSQPAFTQGTLATQLLAGQGITSQDCSLIPVSNVCNQPEALDVALTITGNLRQNGALFNQHLTFDSIQNWVNAQLPLGARIQWFGVGAHFIALDGCKVLSTGQQLVHVQDPDPNASTCPGFWDYDALVSDYREAGFWSDSYLVTA